MAILKANTFIVPIKHRGILYRINGVVLYILIVTFMRSAIVAVTNQLATRPHTTERLETL